MPRKKEKVIVTRISDGRTFVFSDRQNAGDFAGVTANMVRVAIFNGRPYRGYVFDFAIDGVDYEEALA